MTGVGVTPTLSTEKETGQSKKNHLNLLFLYLKTQKSFKPTLFADYLTNKNHFCWLRRSVPQRCPSKVFVTSLEEGRKRRVANILEMGGSGSVLETQKKSWVTTTWKVPQQRDGSACGIYLLAMDIAITRGWSVQDSTSADQSWVRKARAWFLKVSLANTARAPLGPCARCGGVELNAVVRAGARMCRTCAYPAEASNMEQGNQNSPHRRSPRREPTIIDLQGGEETSYGQGSGGCLEALLSKGGVPENDSSGVTTEITRQNSQPSMPVTAGYVTSLGASDTMHLRISKGQMTIFSPSFLSTKTE